MLIDTLADLETYLKRELLSLRVGSPINAEDWSAWLLRQGKTVAYGIGPTVAAAIASAIADYESKRGGQK